MAENKYILRYLPLFYEDISDKIDYIAGILQNRQAANDLIDAVEEAINERLPYAESFEIYHSVRDKKTPYYRIYVGNYTIFYVVLEENGRKIMEVRRFLYNGQDSQKTV